MVAAALGAQRLQRVVQLSRLVCGLERRMVVKKNVAAKAASPKRAAECMQPGPKIARDERFMKWLFVQGVKRVLGHRSKAGKSPLPIHELVGNHRAGIRTQEKTSCHA